MQKIKFFFAIILLSGLLISIAGCSNRAKDLEQISEDDRIIIRFSHVVAESSPKGKAAKLFAQLVQERTKGKVEVQVYPNSTLYKDGEEIKALLDNNVQIIAPATAKLTEMYPEWQVFDLPFLFNNYMEVHRVMDGELGQRLFEIMKKDNIMGLAMWDSGFKQISAVRSIKEVEDFHGLIFRTMPSPVLKSQFELLGASIKELPFSEVYSALQTGVANASENPLSNFYSKKFYRVQPHLTISNHGYLAYTVLTNASFWNSLPDEIRIILEETLKEVTLWEREEAQKQNAEVEKLLGETGTTIYYLTDKQKEEWKRLLHPIYEMYIDDASKELIGDLVGNNSDDCCVILREERPKDLTYT
ncbi:MAG: C4-dicarboxylate ABC transporter [Clostridiaceae bacterium BRH_c20a]|nr:MAG: C4-dicarboxylate ABC transporter [Clostridiaceae bacterium BRH_c20a]